MNNFSNREEKKKKKKIINSFYNMHNFESKCKENRNESFRKLSQKIEILTEADLMFNDGSKIDLLRENHNRQHRRL